MPIKPSPPQAAQGTPYTPTSIEPNIFEKFEGINTATTRPGVDDKEMWWCDGFMPLGPNRNLRTMPDIGTLNAITAPGQKISFFDFGNIGATPYAIVVMTEGSIYAFNTNTASLVQIAGPGTLTVTGRSGVGICSYGDQYVIIVAAQANGYFLWNGTTFFTPGSPAPTGGFMPTGVGGSAVEVYSGRIWIANGASITFSAPGAISDFSGANGGGGFVSSDSFLKVNFVGLRQTNGFLYLIADSSINYISSVQTSGSPPVTTFTNQNADPEVGSPWPGTIDVFNRNILFANTFGAHISYGGAVTKTSEKLDGVYGSLYPNFGGLVPSAAKAIVFGKRIWCLLLTVVDPINGQASTKLFCWNSKIWWATQQGAVLTYVQHQEINSVITAWGTDGKNLFRLFQNPSVNFTKTVQSKLWDAPGGYQLTKATSRLWALFQYYNASDPNINISIDNESGSNFTTYQPGLAFLVWSNAFGTITWSNAFGIMTWASSNTNTINVLQPEAVGQVGVLTGITAQTNAADMAIISMMIQNDIVQNRG